MSLSMSTEVQRITDPIQSLQKLIAEYRMTPADLGKVLGNAKLGDKILRHEVRFTQKHMERLSHHFHVSPAVLMSMAE